VRQPRVTEAALRFGEIASVFRRMAKPLRSRHHRVNAKSFGVTVKRVNPKVFASGAKFPFDITLRMGKAVAVMKTNETYETDLAGVGPKLLAHSKAAEFTARRGLVVELFPFIYGASERMSAKAISHFLETEQGIKLSSVTINKALKDPAKNWNLFFDEVEQAARIFVEDDGMLKMRDLLFRKEYFWKRAKHPLLKAAVNALTPAKVGWAINVLREKWFVIDWEVRLKARPYLEHRLDGK